MVQEAGAGPEHANYRNLPARKDYTLVRRPDDTFVIVCPLLASPVRTAILGNLNA